MEAHTQKPTDRVYCSHSCAPSIPVCITPVYMQHARTASNLFCLLTKRTAAPPLQPKQNRHRLPYLAEKTLIQIFQASLQNKQL